MLTQSSSVIDAQRRSSGGVGTEVGTEDSARKTIKVSNCDRRGGKWIEWSHGRPGRPFQALADAALARKTYVASGAFPEPIAVAPFSLGDRLRRRRESDPLHTKLTLTLVKGRLVPT